MATRRSISWASRLGRRLDSFFLNPPHRVWHPHRELEFSVGQRVRKAVSFDVSLRLPFSPAAFPTAWSATRLMAPTSQAGVTDTCGCHRRRDVTEEMVNGLFGQV